MLKGADFRRRLVSRTADGIDLQPLHAARTDIAAVPGLRGAARWSVAARVDHPDSDEAARQALDDLNGGADMLTLAFAGSRSARGYGIAARDEAALDARWPACGWT